MADSAKSTEEKRVETVDRVTIRFAGDSGDGIQLSGNQFTLATAYAGNDLGTLPDFPAEIRAPAGSLPGVSNFQISFGEFKIHTPGDAPDVLVAMNPAALKVNLNDLDEGGTIIANEDSFVPFNLKKAGYEENPLKDGSLKAYRLIPLPITSLNAKALENSPLNKKERERCKNFYALGVVYWMYDRPLEPTLEWIAKKFKKQPEFIEANQAALRAGFNFANTTEIFTSHYKVRKAPVPPGEYRNITGTEATVLGFVAASELSKTDVFYGSYPITPASDVLQELARHKNFGVKTFQAEDEIAAVCASIGASFAGSLAITGTSGPGVALKSEAIGLAVMTELPLVILNVQRAGPSTGMPTKTEQADLLQAAVGRNGECPVAVLAAATPADCFETAIEACRIAVKYMTPVVMLTDGYLTNGSEPWRLPNLEDLQPFTVNHSADPESFHPYTRDEKTLARAWVVPGMPGLEHRIGGLEKWDVTGNVSYDPANHEHMVRTRAEKIRRIANELPPTTVHGEPQGELLIIGWGSTYGSIMTAVERVWAKGKKVSYVHLRHISPFPNDLGQIIKNFDTVLVPELNMGQLRLLLRGEYGLPITGLNKIQGRPFRIGEIERKIEELI
ncbi:MAG: 2-oxoacid:acceptor oxidoreductase subunit alpha [candidate division Zixibacteria bacterium]|nr:2-oxoacid:acceptor oxidoreductase subunit alpha [candidate division Zixibacteria bacterium]